VTEGPATPQLLLRQQASAVQQDTPSVLLLLVLLLLLVVALDCSFIAAAQGAQHQAAQQRVPPTPHATHTQHTSAPCSAWFLMELQSNTM
jgi:hypothetical protein